MANNYKIDAKQLTPGNTVHIRGKLTFSRLAKLIEGEELARVEANRAKNRMNPVGKPHTSVSLAQAEVIYGDPQAPTLDEQFVAERRYQSAKHPEHGHSYSMENKSPNLPIVYAKNDNGQFEQVILENDLAADLDTELVLRAFQPKGWANCGLSLDMVLIHEPIRYYNALVNTGELAKRGIILAHPPKLVPGNTAGGPEASTASADAESAVAGYLPPNTDPATGLPAPAQMPAAVQTSAPAPVVQQPVAPQAPAAQPPVETQEEKIARLEAQLAAQEVAKAHSGGDSPFDAPAQQQVPTDDPWQTPATPQTAANGISYSE
ncbi:hypothetical protein ANMWB30_24670 [Arthrobacter sp. MWB30]|nr:hypothetical protein ANMWB30_24670 [Arthrobacter sp. MWB30]